MKNPKLQAIIGQSESNFSNFFGGRISPVGVDQYSSMQGGRGQVPVTMLPETKELVFTIKNTDDTNDLAAPLFSAFENIAVPFNGVVDTITGATAAAAKGIVIGIKNYTAAELKSKIISNPFVIRGHRYLFGDDTQLKQGWVHRHKDGDNISVNDAYEPQTKINLASNVLTQLEDPNYQLIVDGGTTLFIKVAAGKEVKIVFKVAVGTNMTQALLGQSVIEKNGATFAQNKDARVF